MLCLDITAGKDNLKDLFRKKNEKQKTGKNPLGLILV
jgi:hypothetical protein